MISVVKWFLHYWNKPYLIMIYYFFHFIWHFGIYNWKRAVLLFSSPILFRLGNYTNATLEEGLPRWLSDKESTCQCRRRVWFLDWKDPLAEEMTTHSSILSWRIQDRVAWWSIVHRIAKSWTRLSNWACTHLT